MKTLILTAAIALLGIGTAMAAPLKECRGGIFNLYKCEPNATVRGGEVEKLVTNLIDRMDGKVDGKPVLGGKGGNSGQQSGNGRGGDSGRQD